MVFKTASAFEGTDIQTAFQAEYSFVKGLEAVFKEYMHAFAWEACNNNNSLILVAITKFMKGRDNHLQI